MDLIESFLAYVSVEKGLSKNTVGSYRFDLKKFATFLAFRKRDIPGFSKHDVVDFIQKLRDEGYSTASICRFISAIRSFCRYLLLENHVLEDPSESLESPRRWERLPKAISIEDVKTLLETGDRRENHACVAGRDWVMFELLYSCGQ